MTDYDVVVIGAGAAGLTAAREAAAGGARTLLVDRLGVGGQVLTVEGIENFPGTDGAVAGFDLGTQLLEQAEDAGAEVLLDEIAGLAPDGDGFLVSGGEREVTARAVVVAAGSTRRALGVPGEERLEGSGVSHCASCDGPFFRQKRVVVVGGGDSAMDEARILAGFADEVLVVHRGEQPTARSELVTRTLAEPGVRVVARATVSEVHGDDRLEAVTVRDVVTGEEHREEAQGLFVYVGLDPNTAWLAELVDLDDDGRIVVDDRLATRQPRLYAAGDLRSGSAAMLAESVADGERAARAVLEDLGVAAARS